MKLERSLEIFDAAQGLIPGGVNSPVRAYKGVGGTPPHMVSGKGAMLVDVDGNEYVDLVLSYGPMILGHAQPEVTAAVQAALERGTTFGAPTEGEYELARLIVDRFQPSVEMVRLVNSGTEATMSALRLARAATGRDKLIKFNGCYHGHGDSFLVQAGSGALTLGEPDSPGVPRSLAELTLVAEFNDLASVKKLFDAHQDGISCVFVEPVAGNMGCVRPAPDFLEGLRRLCDQHGALLVFDEVMTGFRVARGGYQELTDVRPDLVTLGKIIGGGMPIGAYGGRAELMNQIAPAGPVYQAGTLSGNPIAVAAGRTTLEILDRPGTYEALAATSAELSSGLADIAAECGVPMFVGHQGAMLCPYLSDKPVTRFQDVLDSDRERWTKFFNGMLERGVHLPPSPFEAWFLSTAHGEREIAHVLQAARESFAASA